MLDIKFLRQNPELVKENIKKKFKEEKLLLVDEVMDLDENYRKVKARCDELRGLRNSVSKEIGVLFSKGMKEEAEKAKREVVDYNQELSRLEIKERDMSERIYDIMLKIPQIISPETPIGRDESENVEIRRYGEPTVFDFEVPYHVDLMESFSGIDIESARKTSGTGFYYLLGDVARVHSAILSYARDFMIDKGFVYCIPPFMIRSDVVSGVMSFADMESMMYKIEGEDLYLIGTSEHSMIGKFIDTILPEETLPHKLTSYSPCFRKEVGAHGIEERGVYRIHQFEKQEMIVVCRPEDSEEWYERLWNNTVEFFRSLDIPVRTLECCSGDLADLKVRSVDIEGWSPRQQKYFEVGSCSNMGDAQARRLAIRVQGEDGRKYIAHTLNNTVVAPPRMLICFFENNLNQDGSVTIPKALRPYMGGKEAILPKDKNC
ncbi:MAG: serine--tRNA ligase [Eubacterium sp.]|jgi:seryl-tRNA synthetase|nr:serine--tRNA ligase [Eubacterium sp.]